MNKSSKAPLRRVDPNDPTLALDGLDDFLPGRPDDGRATLADSSLADFFEDPPDAVGEHASREVHTTLEVNNLADYFSDREELPVLDIDPDLWEFED